MSGVPRVCLCPVSRVCLCLACAYSYACAYPGDCDAPEILQSPSSTPPSSTPYQQTAAFAASSVALVACSLFSITTGLLLAEVCD